MICFKPMTTTHNLNLEILVTLTSFDCPAMPQGCTAKMSVSTLSDHYKYCDFKIIRCPVSLVEGMTCFWHGMRKEFPSHAREHLHLNLPLERYHQFSDCFSLWPVKTGCLFVFHGDEIFLYYKFLFKDRWFCVVQQAGMTRRKYECAFQLAGSNGFDHIRMTLAVREADETFARIFHFKYCFRMSARMISHFIDDNYMNMTIYIKDVTKPTNP
jgi:hypothetical protein